jgi:hypothetical protein
MTSGKRMVLNRDMMVKDRMASRGCAVNVDTANTIMPDTGGMANTRTMFMTLITAALLSRRISFSRIWV